MEELTVQAAIARRRSTKHFKTDPIAPDLLHQLIDAAVQAPSSYNLQPWRIVVVDEAAQKRALCDAAFGQPQIREAPVSLIFAVSLGGWKDDIEPMVRTAIECGSWSADYGEIVMRDAPKLQEHLEGAGRLREYAIKDVMIAASFLALCAESHGLSSCFMNGWMENTVKSIIGAKDNDDIAVGLVMPIGHPLESPRHPGRFPRSHNVFQNTLDKPYS